MENKFLKSFKKQLAKPYVIAPLAIAATALTMHYYPVKSSVDSSEMYQSKVTVDEKADGSSLTTLISKQDQGILINNSGLGDSATTSIEVAYDGVDSNQIKLFNPTTISTFNNKGGDLTVKVNYKR